MPKPQSRDREGAVTLVQDCFSTAAYPEHLGAPALLAGVAFPHVLAGRDAGAPRICGSAHQAIP